LPAQKQSTFLFFRKARAPMTYKELLTIILDATVLFLPGPYKILAMALRALVAHLAILDNPLPFMAAPDSIKDLVTMAFDKLAEGLADRPIMARMTNLLRSLIVNRLLDKVWDALVAKGVLTVEPGAANPHAVEGLAAADFATEEAELFACVENA
jgi:hypothetical protein